MNDDENSTDASNVEEEEDRICNELESYDFEDCISQAPLHVAQPTRRWISADRLELLKQSFPNLRRDRWTNEEKKTLRENWERIETHWPQYSDPKFAFGDGHDNEGKWTAKEIEEKRREYKEFKVMLRMANGLDNRLVCDIHVRCRKKYYDKSFHFKHRRDVPTALDKQVRRDLKLKESIKLISHKYNVAPSVVDTIRRRPRRKKRVKWSDEELTDLKLAIESFHGDGGEVLARNIKWKRVAKEMKKMNHQKTKTQCYNKWIRLNPGSVVKRYDNVTDDK